MDHTPITAITIDGRATPTKVTMTIISTAKCRCFTTDSLPRGYPGQYVRALAYVELDG